MANHRSCKESPFVFLVMYYWSWSGSYGTVLTCGICMCNEWMGLGTLVWNAALRFVQEQLWHAGEHLSAFPIEGQETVRQGGHVAHKFCISCVDKTRADVFFLNYDLILFSLSLFSPHSKLATLNARMMPVCKDLIQVGCYAETVGCPLLCLCSYLLFLFYYSGCSICVWKCGLCYTSHIADSGFV